ncbi:hypothetical protein KQX54_003105 [Cotesia glomerata]|uniref:Reverse transcriptase zinc-binding domain-containing protein n=1 Tax=Cotesia glomerata TaxID=32391 RepID=A0AAV7IFM1_COTGL|nr:hypothetical protein KQX54_003105 [Cotesia glomerata]
MGIRNDPYCVYCPGVADTAEHTFFDCQRWSEIRLRWREEKEVPQRPEDVVPWMLTSTDNWTAMTGYVLDSP